MAEETKNKKKRTWQKYLVIAGVVFALLLTICGVVAINNSKEDGSTELLEDNASLMDAMYEEDSETDDAPLTDEQFSAALTKIFPYDKLTEAEQRASVVQLEQTLADANISASVHYFNSYGDVGFLIVTTNTIEEVKPVLDFNLGSVYYVHCRNVHTYGIDDCYKVTNDSVECRFSQGMSLGTAEPLENISNLSADLLEQYNIDNLVLTSDVILIYSYGLSTGDLLNVFDYTYQWCLQNKCDRQIILYSSDSVVAATNKQLADDYYTENYPVQELAALFRLKYYTAECFFDTSIQDTCNLYLS